MKIQNKALLNLSLGMKAGCVASGEFMTEKAVKEHRALLVIVAEDASENTKKKFRNMCEFHKVKMTVFSNKIDLGNAIGKEFRASLAVVDAGFAKMIEKNLNMEVN